MPTREELFAAMQMIKDYCKSTNGVPPSEWPDLEEGDKYDEKPV